MQVLSIDTISQARVTYSDGHRALFKQITRAPGGAVIPIDEKGKVLIAREYRPRLQRYAWIFPGGRGEVGERARTTALRELREETGLMAREAALFHVFRFGNTLGWKDYYFLGKKLYPVPLVHNEDEDITLVPKTIPQLFSMLMAGDIEHPHVAYVILKLYRLRTRILRWAMSPHRASASFL